MKYCDALVLALQQHDVTTMFGVLGDANMYYGSSFTRSPVSGKFVSSSHEGGGVLMAAGYAAVTGQVGVATVTHGAITNILSALFDAARGGYPVVVIAGDTARSQGDSLQNLPHSNIVLPTGASFMEARTPDDVFADVGRAFHQAVSRRGPVVLNIPSDYQTHECDPKPYKISRRHLNAGVPSREGLEDAAAIIIGSSRPLLVAGRGAAAATGEIDQISLLAARMGAPIATTLQGNGLFLDDPFNIGICGTLSNPVAAEIIAKCDCIIAVGASLNVLTSFGGELFDGKKIVQIDQDADALGRSYPVDVGLLGDANDTAAALIEVLDEAGAEPVQFRSAQLRNELDAWEKASKLVRSKGSVIDIHDALHRIESVVPRDKNLTVDIGRFAHVALKILKVSHPQHYVHAGNIGQIGLSLSYGIGAAVGDAERPTVVIVGDGGFMLGGLTEFNTAVRHATDLIVFVMNDMAYGAEYHRFVPQDMNTELVTFQWPDLASVAESLGGTGIAVKTVADLDLIKTTIDSRDGLGPILFDIRLDRDSIPDPGLH